MQFTFLVVIPTTNASIASFWLRLGRNLYENPGNSAYRSRSSLPPPFDDLVLKCGDSEPALPTSICIVAVMAVPHMLPLELCIRIRDACLIVLPRQPVYIGRSALLRFEEHRRRSILTCWRSEVNRSFFCRRIMALVTSISR